MDCRQVAGEPCWQVDVGDRTVLGAERLGNIGERAAESIGREDQAFRSDHGARDCSPAYSTYTMQDSMENQTSVCAALIARSASLASALGSSTAALPARFGLMLRRGAGRASRVAGIVVLPRLAPPGQQAN